MARRRMLKIDARRKFDSWEKALEAFLMEKRAGGLAERTLSDYRWHVERFFKRYPGAWQDEAWLRKAVLEYFSVLSKENSAAYYNLCLRNLKGFFKWCCEQELFSHNPITFSQKKELELNKAAEKEDLIKLIEYLKSRQNTFTGVRDLALLLLSLDTGLRPAEILQLKPENFNIEGREVHVPASVSKTRRGRTVVYSPTTAKQLLKLMQIRPREWGDEVPMFPNEYGQPFLPSSWGHRLKKYSEMLGIKVTPYSLRHASAIFSLRSGATPFFVQKQLGHTSMNTTKRYVELTLCDMHREMEQASPVAHLLPLKTRMRKVDKDSKK